MSDFERRLERHIETHESAMVAIGERLLKIETNHLAHMEADMRFIKEFAVRMERTMAEFAAELKKNSEMTHKIELDHAKAVGDQNAKIAALETREGSNSGWTKDLLKIVVGALVGAATAFIFKG